VHDDLLALVDAKGVVRHELTATRPNEVWLTDISEHPTAEGKLYLCAVKEVYSNKVVGYSIDSRMSPRSQPARSGTRSRSALRLARSVTATEAANFVRRRSCGY
jgi:transposase InsO family protein